MGKHYRCLNNESHKCMMALRAAYDRGYEQAKSDYKRRDGYWTLKLVASGGEYECSECKKHSMAPGFFCQICGSKMDRKVLIEQTNRKVNI